MKIGDPPYSWKTIFFIICLKEEKENLQLTLEIVESYARATGEVGRALWSGLHLGCTVSCVSFKRKKSPSEQNKLGGGCRFIVTSPTFYSGTEGFVGSICGVMRLSSPEKLHYFLEISLLCHNKRPLVIMQVLTGGWSERWGLFDFNTWDRYLCPINRRSCFPQKALGYMKSLWRSGSLIKINENERSSVGSWELSALLNNHHCRWESIWLYSAIYNKSQVVFRHFNAKMFPKT